MSNAYIISLKMLEKHSYGEKVTKVTVTSPSPNSSSNFSPVTPSIFPSLVDNLMTDALTLGAQMDRKVIDTDVILASVSSQNLG